jgi:hypothetical protein
LVLFGFGKFPEIGMGSSLEELTRTAHPTTPNATGFLVTMAQQILSNATGKQLAPHTGRANKQACVT